MAGSVILKTFRGGNVTPQNDAIIYQTVIPGAGVFKGCGVTCARGNILHISQGFGMIKGRFFEMYENEVSVQLAETGQTLDGRLYVHMDLSNADEPIKVIAETGETLPALMMDANVNYNNSTYDMELAAFRVDAGGVLDLTQTFPTVQAGGGSGGGGGTGIQRDTMYALGDIVYTGNAPGWCSLVCTQEGTTALAEPVGYTQVKKAGDKVLDGSCVFTARSIFGELDAAAGNLTKTAADLGQLRDEFEQSKSDTADLVFKLMSLEEYAALEDYDSATMYYCYAKGNPAQIRAVYFGGNVIFAAGVTVSYHVDTDTVVKQTASLSDDLVADAPPAVLDGYTFVGWRGDNVPGKAVLTKKILDSEEAVDLYAVFKRPITIGMLDNGAALIDGRETEEFDDTLYYNNGNAESEGITIPECPYEWEGKTFCGWNTDSYSDPTYIPGQKGTFSGDSYLFPMFVDTVYDFPYTGSYVPFTIPADGIYEFELYGAAGGNVSATVNSEQLTANHSQDTRYTGPLETAPTVNATYGMGGNNQPFVVETPKTLKIRSGCEGGGKGALIQDDKSATLSCNNDQTVFVPFCKGARPHSAEEAPTWKDGEVANTLNAFDIGETRCNELVVQAFGICSKESNAMKSDNPHSGFYEAQTARTLDCNCNNPSSNQGGIAVVAVQGSMIGREDKNGPQGSGVNEDVSFTLNATDHHAVAYPTYCASKSSFFTSAEEEVANTLVATDYKDPPLINALQTASGKDVFGTISASMGSKQWLGNQEAFSGDYHIVEPDYIVRRLTPTECARLQGFPDWWCSGLETETPSDGDMAFWREVFETHRRIMGTSSKPKSDSQIRKWLKDPHSDSAEYKMWGNGVALPNVYFVLSGIVYYAQFPDFLL